MKLTDLDKEMLDDKVDAFMAYLDVVNEIILHMHSLAYVPGGDQASDDDILNALNSLSRTFDIVSAGIKLAEIRRNEWELMIEDIKSESNNNI